MKEFIDWFFENHPNETLMKKGNKVTLTGFQDAQIISMAIECGCNGISPDSSASIQFQFD